MHQEIRPIPPSKLKKETTTRSNQSPVYENGFNGYSFSCSKFVIRLCIVDSMEEEMLESPMTELDDGNVTKLDILLLLVTH